jgi:diguanylate cyclase (GGDEF)-like protein
MSRKSYVGERLDKLIAAGEKLLGTYNKPGNIAQHDLWFTEARNFLAVSAPIYLEKFVSIGPKYHDQLLHEAHGRAAYNLIREQLEVLRLAKGELSETGVQASTPKEPEQKFGILWSPGQAERDFNDWANTSQAADQPISVLFLDIDHFKALNSKYTETVVDQAVLRPFQERLLEICQYRGETYRHGGDEFVVILRNCNVTEAAEFADRLRRDLAATAFSVGNETVHITVSGGVAGWRTNGGTYNEVLRAANEAKKHAKETRNAVRLAPSKALLGHEPPGAPPLASPEEIEVVLSWFESPSSEVRRDAASALLDIAYKKRVFHYEPLRGAIRRLMKDPDEEVRIKALEIHTALMRWERASVRRYYAQPLVTVAERDPSPRVRTLAMSAIGATGDTHYCEWIYLWITTWTDDAYRQAYPTSALIGLASTGLKEKIRNDLRSLLEQTYDSTIRGRLAEALKAVSSR